jgi:hypothetical protein
MIKLRFFIKGEILKTPKYHILLALDVFYAVKIIEDLHFPPASAKAFLSSSDAAAMAFFAISRRYPVKQIMTKYF